MFSSKDNPFHRMFQLRVGDMYFSRDLYKKSKMYTFRSEINLHEAMEIYYYSKMDYTDIKEPFIYSDSYFKISKSLYDFYDLYLKYYLPFKIENENFGHFPDFIIQIHTDFYNDPTTPKKEIAMLDKLREINRGKYVVFPNVQVIEGSVPLFGGVPVAGIGGGHFTHIMGKVFADQSFEVLSLPQSVYVIDKKAINFLSVKVLRLTNFYSDDLHSHTSYFGNFFYQQERDGKTVYATNLQKIIFDFNDFRLLEITEYQYVLDIEKDIELLQDYDLTEEPIKAMIEKLHLDKKLLPSYIYRVSKKEDEKRAKALHYQLARIKKKKED